MNPDLSSAIGSIAGVESVAGVGSVASLPGFAGGGLPGLAVAGLDGAEGVGNVAGATGKDFGQWFGDQLAQVNGQLHTVDREMQTLAVGGQLSLHQFMIHMEEAKLGFQLVAQVRNHLLEAYQEVMRMQV